MIFEKLKDVFFTYKNIFHFFIFTEFYFNVS